ncbi:MAG: hypothetical protein KDB07_12240 [Planctomycetes bacterium]|nr:hypothetical protein [Planctomycetota bacterium]
MLDLKAALGNLAAALLGLKNAKGPSVTRALFDLAALGVACGLVTRLAL